MSKSSTNRHASFTFALLICSTVIGLAGTDLVLPAIPVLPEALEGSIEQAQLVLATFAAGTGIGLLLFGELGARFDQRKLLVISLASYAALSAAATLADTIAALVAIRFLQGLAGSAAAVFAPGMIRKTYGETGSVRALGLMGSIESVVPALAPVLGAWLLVYFDWRSSFVLIAVVAMALAVIWGGFPQLLPREERRQASGSGYVSLLTNPVYQKYAMSMAFTLGGLLVFVFGAPTVITLTMNGSLTDFVVMQVIGIVFFILAANTSGGLAERFGSERLILAGSLLGATGFSLILIYALAGGENPRMLWGLFVISNFGLGLRGPPGFYQAVVAAGDNDARGAALLLLYVLLTAATGTACVAPFIKFGLVPLSAAAAGFTWASVLLLIGIRKQNG